MASYEDATKGSPQEQRGPRLVRLYSQAKSMRSELDAHCLEIAERILPRQVGDFFGHPLPEGSKRTDRILDAGPAKGLERFAAVMESISTPRNSRWHRLRASDKTLMKSLRVRQYFDDVNDTLFRLRYSTKANYPTIQHESYMSMGAFGTGQFRVEKPREEGERGFRYTPIHLGRIYFLADYQGRIRTAIRAFFYNARQAVEMFAPDGNLDKLPPAVKREYEKPVGQRSERQTFEFIQVIMPNEARDRQALDHRGMPFTSEYVCVESKHVVETGGYRTWPIPINRYVTGPGEVYGRSPAMLALPAIKTLNEEKRVLLMQGHRAVQPIILGADDGVIDKFSLRPGHFVAGGVSPSGQKLVHEFGQNARVDVGLELMQLERKDIDDLFLVTLFQILVETPQMTATEVLERVREKGLLLAPTAGRQQVDCAGPMIERELDLAAEQGLLPQMPPELVEAEGEYEVEYESPLARMQKAEEVVGLNRTLQIIAPYVELTGDRTPLMHLNMDKALPTIAWTNAVPADWMRSEDEVAGLKEQALQQAQAQQAIEAAPAVAGLAKAAGPDRKQG